ncbi:MAG TPA: aspartate dehydrogenase domain-containing protein [Trebonia sp.]
MISVAVVGCGAIGGVVARSLRAGEVPGATLKGIVTRNAKANLPALSLSRALESADLVVEAAGQQALAEIAPQVPGSRAILLVVSVGALRDDATFKLLASVPPGRVHLTTGAVGGLDMLRSAARMGPLDAVRIVTTKKPAALVQPWMSPGEAGALRSATGPVEIRRGPAKEIAGAFPQSANVAAAVALAAGDWDLVEAVVMADPGTAVTSHVIMASGAAGEYKFEIRNRPSPANPKTSEVVPYAVLAAIEDIAGGGAWTFR